MRRRMNTPQRRTAMNWVIRMLLDAGLQIAKMDETQGILIFHDPVCNCGTSSIHPHGMFVRLDLEW